MDRDRREATLDGIAGRLAGDDLRAFRSLREENAEMREACEEALAIAEGRRSGAWPTLLDELAALMREVVR